MYRDYYRPSFNPIRFLKSIIGVLVYKSGSMVEHDKEPMKKTLLK